MNYIMDNFIDEQISKTMIEKNKAEELAHRSSGKLSAGMLGSPLQWQILKIKGVPQKPLDEYVLRKFQRGKDVENWFMSVIPNLVEKQKFVEYRGCVGYADALVDTSTHHFNCGIIPHECKSVANAKFKIIKKTGDADRSHKLQACMYALAIGASHFAIDYIASDDYRIITMVFHTEDYKAEVDRIIDRFHETLEQGVVPEFVPEEKWQASKDYSSYPEFQDLKGDELLEKIKEYVK